MKTLVSFKYLFVLVLALGIEVTWHNSMGVIYAVCMVGMMLTSDLMP
jgi:hypothetical protein